ncbi:glycosyl hydrolase [Spirochaetia bacterium]|nr:glycosyl hydrolase [Spirochaetia bacterium]
MKNSNDLSALLAQLTLEEKASLCSGLNDHFTKPIDRLGIPSVEVSDGPHGLRQQMGDDVLARHKATCFPADVATASSWNPDIAFRIGEAIGKECRAANVAVILGPAMNIKRSPLCGRNFEYFSEDPYLSGKIAASYVKGVQSQGVGACLKHFAANNQEYLRMGIDARIGERALREIYLRGFEIAVKEAKPKCIMAAYNRINGVFCTENKALLTGILRGEWGFDGIVMSDWGAVNVREDALAAGLDLEMPSSYGYGDMRIVTAVTDGRLREEDLDTVVLRMLEFVFGAFESLNGEMPQPIDTDKQHALAREIAEECIVLLKNEDGILPLSNESKSDSAKKKLAIIGGMAKHPRYQGGGSSNVEVYRYDVPFDEITGRASGSYTITYSEGYEAEDNNGFFSLDIPVSPSNVPNESLIRQAAETAGQSDLAIVFVGLPEATESEATDRIDMRLPVGQEELVKAVLKVQPNTIVILNNGSPVEMDWAKDARAIIESYVGGQGGAFALARILFGEICPSAKLAETFAEKYADTPAVKGLASDKYESLYTEGIMVGYRYYDAKGLVPLFPFGHGLSYTTFEYGNLSFSSEAITDADTVDVSVEITNTGNVAGAEIVQFYVSLVNSRILHAAQELKGFKKVFLQPGATRKITVTLDREAFSRYDEKSHFWVVDAGLYEVKAAASSRDIRLVGRIAVTNLIPKVPVFDLNTPIEEIASYPKALEALFVFLKPFIASSFLAQMPGTDEEIAMKVLQRFGDMPLRSLALTGNQLPTQAIEQLTAYLNAAVMQG